MRVLGTLNRFFFLLLVWSWQVEMTSILLVCLMGISNIEEEHSHAEARKNEHMERIS